MTSVFLAWCAAIVVGCGGPSPQDAEDHVRDTLEETEGVQVRGVLCKEIDGDRFECEVDRALTGFGAAGRESSRVIVEAGEVG